MSEDQVALWSLPAKIGLSDSVIGCTRNDCVPISVGMPKDIVFGKNIYFVGYGEDQYLRANSEEIASQMVVAFDRDATFLFGMRDILRNEPLLGSATEMRLGCVTEKDDAIFTFHGSDHFWRIVPAEARVERIMSPVEVHKLAALSECGGKIYFAIKGVSEIFFFHLNLMEEKVEFDGLVNLSILNISDNFDVADEKYFRIRGVPGGKMTISTGKSIWCVGT